MKCSTHALWAAALLCALAGAAPLRADTLQEIYELALEHDAELKSREASYRAALENARRSRAALLPQISARYEHSETETESTSQSFNFNASGMVLPVEVGSVLDTKRQGYQLSLNQALFDLPAWVNYLSGRKLSRQAEAAFAADQQDLILRVVEGYLGALRAQDELEAAAARERAFQRQFEQARLRFQVGLIAITEVHEARAAQDLAKVDKIAAENRLNVALEQLSVLTGRRHAGLHRLQEKFEAKSPEPETRSAWVEFALGNNYRLAAARHAESAARRKAWAGRLEHLPKVSGSLSYSDYETRGTRVEMPPSLFNLPPDSEQEQEIVAVRVEMPLFAGGGISASRRQAVQEYLAARESRIGLQRATVANARALHMTVLSDIARVNARRQSLISSQSALDATTAGYEVGTRNIVDLLNAQNVLYGAKRDYAFARYDYVQNMMRLKQAAGLLSPEDVGRLDGEMVAAAEPEPEPETAPEEEEAEAAEPEKDESTVEPQGNPE